MMVVSLTMQWMRRGCNCRQATLIGFYDFISANCSNKSLLARNGLAFLMVTKNMNQPYLRNPAS